MPRHKKSTARKRNKNHPLTSPAVPSGSNTVNSIVNGLIANGGTDSGIENQSDMNPLAQVEGREMIGELNSYCEHQYMERILQDLVYSHDKYAMALLVALYFFQGIHMGIASGSLPVLLRSKLGDDQLDIFSLAAYLGSLELLWSPIVDSIFSYTFGRRKSWIATTGFASGLLMIWSNAHVQRLMDDVDPDVGALTTTFASLAFLAASNCIAVDGWAPTLLSVENMPYASAARTIGLNTGYFLSGSVFVALNSADFSNKYIRVVPSDLPLLSLGGYLQFWGVSTCIAAFAFVMLTTEYPVDLDEPYINLRIVWEIMWDICNLDHVKSLFMMQMVAAIGFQVNDSLTSLKLVEKGFNSEDFSMATLIHVPAQIIGGWYGALWSRGPLPLRSWFWVLWVCLAFAVATMSLVYMPPNANSLPLSYFWGIVFLIGLNSFILTVQSISMSAFHLQICDPLVGGTYMTLLNTVGDFGEAWPRHLTRKVLDWFSQAVCHIQQEGGEIIMNAPECVSDHGRSICIEMGGTCVTEWGGYYALSWICVGLSAFTLLSYIRPTAKRLQGLHPSRWGAERVWVLFRITFKMEGSRGSRRHR